MKIKNHFKVTHRRGKLHFCTFALVTIITFVFTIYAGQTKVFANYYYWAIECNGSEIVATSSELNATKMVNKFKQSYLTKGSEKQSAKCENELKISEKILDEDGYSQKANYTTDIDKGVSALRNSSSTIRVHTDEIVTNNISTDYKVKKVKDDTLEKGETKVKTKGKKGILQVKNRYVKINGKTVTKNIVSKRVIRNPVTEVVLVGTKETVLQASGDEEYADGIIPYSSTGQAVADYALKFVGNPYVYGGSSLTNGADCSGFVMAVYDHFNVSLPHGAVAFQDYGVNVPLSQAKPGDIVCYPAHCAIYIGGGEVVHAMDENNGICVSNIHYNTEVVCVRRIFV